jgi:hypothetical protein
MQEGKIIQCTCKNESQDAMYGKGNRLFNHCKPKVAGEKWYRCTVCKKEITN